MTNWFYLPERLPAPSPATMRCLHFWALCATVFPGIPVSYLLRDSIVWVVVLSMLALSVGFASGWSAERPAELHNPDNGA